jgi:hypothetical protein
MCALSGGLRERADFNRGGYRRAVHVHRRALNLISMLQRRNREGHLALYYIINRVKHSSIYILMNEMNGLTGRWPAMLRRGAIGRKEAGDVLTSLARNRIA